MTHLVNSYFERNLIVVPIEPRAKRPARFDGVKWLPLAEWQKREFSADERKEWATWPDVGLGLVCGERSRIVAVDFDNRPEIIRELARAIPDSPIRKVGERGYTDFYQYSGEQTHKWIVGGETVCEILSTGRQTVLPPSIHPNGKRYEWKQNETLLNFDLKELPRLPGDYVARVTKVIARWEPVVQSVTKNSYSPPETNSEFDDSLEEVSRALDTLNPDLAYEDWMQIGMAIHSRYPGSDGFDLFDSWSRRGAKYSERGSNSTPSKWKSFHGHGITLKTLFWRAKETGQYSPRVVSKGTTIDVIELIRTSTAPKSSSVAVPQNVLESAPGLVGKIASWITATAFRPQPALSLSAALGVVGALKAHRVQTESRLRTNHLCLGVAPSGAGKEHPLGCSRLILEKLNQELLCSGKPVSDSGLLKMLSENGGRRLVLWDEIGHALRSMSGKNAASHSAAILPLMTELWSSAHQTYLGKEYANHGGKSPRMDIYQPHLCVVGATTPETFYSAMSTRFTVDGFFARWLVFETEGRPEKRWDIFQAQTEVPREILDDGYRIVSMTTNAYPQSKQDLDIRPLIVPLDSEAQKLLREADDYFESKAAAAAKAERGIDALWVRGTQHAWKIALTVCSDEIISEADMRWSLELVNSLLERVAVACDERIAETPFEEGVHRMLKFVVDAGGTGRQAKEIAKKFKHVDSRIRDGYLKALTDSGLVGTCARETGGRDSTIYVAL